MVKQNIYRVSLAIVALVTLVTMHFTVIIFAFADFGYYQSSSHYPEYYLAAEYCYLALFLYSFVYFLLSIFFFVVSFFSENKRDQKNVKRIIRIVKIVSYFILLIGTTIAIFQVGVLCGSLGFTNKRLIAIVGFIVMNILSFFFLLRNKKTNESAGIE